MKGDPCWDQKRMATCYILRQLRTFINKCIKLQTLPQRLRQLAKVKTNSKVKTNFHRYSHGKHGSFINLVQLYSCTAICRASVPVAVGTCCLQLAATRGTTMLVLKHRWLPRFWAGVGSKPEGEAGCNAPCGACGPAK